MSKLTIKEATTYVATIPGYGSVERKSHKAYTHAVFFKREAEGNWILEGFCGSQDLAHKAVARMQKREWRGIAEFIIVEVTPA